MTDLSQGPVITEGRRVRIPFNGYVVGGVLFGLSVVVGVLGVVIIVKSLVGDFGDYERVDVPGGGEVAIEEPGTYRIFYEGDVCHDTGSDTSSCDDFSGVPEPTLVASDGDAVSLEPDGGFTYEFGVREGVEVWRVRIEEAGDYELELSQPPLNVNSLAVGKTPSVDREGLLAALVVAPSLGVAAMVVIVITIVRRARVRRDARPPTPPPSAWAGPPQAPVWGPPSSPSPAPPPSSLPPPP